MFPLKKRLDQVEPSGRKVMVPALGGYRLCSENKSFQNAGDQARKRIRNLQQSRCCAGESVSQQTGGARLLTRFMTSFVLSLALKARRDFCVAPTKLQTFRF